MDKTETQQILNEVRQLNAHFDDLAFQIRIDTPWVRVRENIRYCINAVKEIPFFARMSLFGAFILWTVPLFVELPSDIKKKVMMIGVDLFGLALISVAY